MSIESAKAFIERMKTDEEFAKKVNEFKNMEEALSFVASQGYDFTVDEYRELHVVLNEEELSAVAGGLGFVWCPIHPGIEG